MYTPNIARGIKKMFVNEIRYFIFENYYKQIGFSKKNSYYSKKRLKQKELLLLANKLIEKVADPCNAKEHYQSFLRKKNRKSVIQSEITTYQQKTFDTVDIEPVSATHPKTSHKLSKTIIALYIVIQK